MMLDYLKEKEIYLNEEISLRKKDLSTTEILIKENLRFAELLEKSKATPFTEFTPQVVTATDKKQKEGLAEEGKVLLKKKEEIENDLFLLENELEKVVNTISEIKKSKAKSRKSLKKEREDLVKRLSEISDISISDPMRANLEIREVIKNIKSLPLD